MIFKIPNVEEFKFVGDKSSSPHNLVSAITARKMLQKGSQGYLALVRDTTVEKTSISDVPVACEFPDVFLKSCQVYHLTEKFNSVSMWFLTQLLSLCHLIGWLQQS